MKKRLFTVLCIVLMNMPNFSNAAVTGYLTFAESIASISATDSYDIWLTLTLDDDSDPLTFNVGTNSFGSSNYDGIYQWLWGAATFMLEYSEAGIDDYYYHENSWFNTGELTLNGGDSYSFVLFTIQPSETTIDSGSYSLPYVEIGIRHYWFDTDGNELSEYLCRFNTESSDSFTLTVNDDNELPDEIQSYLILTNSSAPFYLFPGNYVQIYGSDGSNTINIKQEARAQFQNFIGANTINIEEETSEFTVYRSGATVFLSSTAGTLIELAATLTPQTLRFADGSSELVISDGDVMLGSQTINVFSSDLESPSDSNDNSLDVF